MVFLYSNNSFDHFPLQEEPLVLGPQHLADKEDMCIACFRRMDPDAPVPCSGCKFPLCSAACSQSKRHQPE